MEIFKEIICPTKIIMKIAIITGASTGIGKAVAFKLAENGYRVLLVARTSKKLNQIMKDIEPTPSA